MNRHCDTYIDDTTQPWCLREFLRFHRLPAVERSRAWHKGELRIPTCYATLVADVTWEEGDDDRPETLHDVTLTAGTRVALTMASRMGDVGITKARAKRQSTGYDVRVWVEQLSDFSEKP